MTNNIYQYILQQQAIPFTSFKSQHNHKKGFWHQPHKKKIFKHRNKKPIKFQGTVAMCMLAGVGKEKVCKSFLLLHQDLDFQPTSHHKGDPSWRHHPVVKTKLSKVSPPPIEGESALPGTNSSSTDPETYISLLHISQPYWSTLGRKARCTKSQCVQGWDTSLTDGAKKLCTQCQL